MTRLIIYETRQHEILYRLVEHWPDYPNHSRTCMGWYIIDILCFYKGSFISYTDYLARSNVDYEKSTRKYVRLVRRHKRIERIIRKVFKKYLS